MPQIFLVLKCYKCLVFQVHQRKKTNKFVCKMCGEKQSIKRHYGIGNGQECRMHVQKLNGIRGELDETKSFGSTASSDEDNDLPPPIKPKERNHSKWSEYVERDEINETNNEDPDIMFLEDTEVVLEVPKKKRQKRFNDNYKYYKGKPNSESNESIKQKTEKGRQYASYSQPNAVVYNTQSFRKDKYQNINKFPTTSVKKTVLKHDSDSEENIDVNLFSQNISKDLKTTNNTIKFITPLLNPNSKWAKFAEYETNETNIEEELSPKVIESQHSGGDDTFVNAYSSLIYSNENISKNEFSTSKNNKECNVMKPTTDQSLLFDVKVDDGNKNDLNFINKDDCGYNHSQKDLKSLFSLCDDNEIDDFLDI